ncbi:hypothetical protein Tco_0009754 [Tanacetum coccineum]
MDWLSKRKFVIVCHEKVVWIPLEGEEILRVHGERTQGVMKTIMNTKEGESDLSDISVVRDFIDVFPEDLSMTTATTKMAESENQEESARKILAAQSEAFKQDNVLAKDLSLLECDNEIESTGFLSLKFPSYTRRFQDVKLARIYIDEIIARNGILIRESSLTGLELVQEMTDKVVLMKEKLKAARDRQKSYEDKRRKPLEFEVGDRVLLRVSPWKGVVRFGKQGLRLPGVCRWCRIAEAPHCLLGEAQWCFNSPRGLVGNNLLKRLAQHVEEALAIKTMESLREIKVNLPLIKEELYEEIEYMLNTKLDQGDPWDIGSLDKPQCNKEH